MHTGCLCISVFFVLVPYYAIFGEDPCILLTTSRVGPPIVLVFLWPTSIPPLEGTGLWVPTNSKNKFLLLCFIYYFTNVLSIIIILNAQFWLWRISVFFFFSMQYICALFTINLNIFLLIYACTSLKLWHLLGLVSCLNISVYFGLTSIVTRDVQTIPP